MITASHNPWTDNGFKVKSPTGAAAGPDILAGVEAVIRGRRSASTPPTPTRSPMPRRPAWSSASTRIDGYVDVRRRTLDLDRLRGRAMRVLVDPLWGSGAGWIRRLLAGGRIRVDEIHTRAQPVVRRASTRSPSAPNIDEALGILAGGGYDLGPAARRRRGPRRRRRRAGHVHPPAPGAWAC